MEEVGNYHREGQTSTLVFARDPEELLLIEVTQLRLPEAARPKRKARCMAGRVGVPAKDVRGRADCKEVVNRAGLGRRPPRDIVGELHAPNCRVVPEKPIAAVAHHEWDRHLSVALNQVQREALVVEAPVRALAHSEKALARVGAELLVDLASPGAISVQHAGTWPPEMLALLREQLLPGGGPNESQLWHRDPIGHRQHDLYSHVAIHEAGRVPVDRQDGCTTCGPHLQGTDVGGWQRAERRAHAHAV